MLQNHFRKGKYMELEDNAERTNNTHLHLIQRTNKEWTVRAILLAPG
jgi:hypothetical protein